MEKGPSLQEQLAIIDKQKHKLIKEFDNQISKLLYVLKEQNVNVYEDVYVDEYHSIFIKSCSINLEFKVTYLCTSITFELSVKYNDISLHYTNNKLKGFINNIIKRINDDTIIDCRETKNYLIRVIKTIDAFAKEHKWWW